MNRTTLLTAAVLPFAMAACGTQPADPRGIDRSETLLSVSASGHAESRPDKAEFQAGIETWAGSAREASAANARKIAEIVSALQASGVEEKDIQTRAVNIQRIEWGDRKGQYQASNIVAVTVRDIARADAAVAAATGAGANVMSGPDLRMTDPEAAANSAYAAAYANARKRAEAYAEAAGMEISRVLYIRDAGGMQGNRYIPGAPPPPPMMPQMAPPEEAAFESGGVIQPGQTTSTVSVQVDFALRAK